mmetsp:Transcript_17599/g.36074  ORF Transcript_17599/g.36074 Transcript_17599/m.36074 type:complete len:223 (-) Transcript_17599:748-1416(-)
MRHAMVMKKPTATWLAVPSQTKASVPTMTSLRMSSKSSYHQQRGLYVRKRNPRSSIALRSSAVLPSHLTFCTVMSPYARRFAPFFSSKRTRSRRLANLNLSSLSRSPSCFSSSSLCRDSPAVECMYASPDSTASTPEAYVLWLKPTCRSHGSSHSTLSCCSVSAFGFSLPSTTDCLNLTRMHSSRIADRTSRRLIFPSSPCRLMRRTRSSSSSEVSPKWCRS